jgi:hypothetical protein
MAADVLHFVQKNNLTEISLLGHSMYVTDFSSCATPTHPLWRGGKVAMSLALHPDLPSSILSNLIVEDIAPNRGKLSDEFLLYIQAMQKIESLKLKTRKEATEVLQEYEKVRSRFPDCLFCITCALGPKPDSIPPYQSNPPILIQWTCLLPNSPRHSSRFYIRDWVIPLCTRGNEV